MLTLRAAGELLAAADSIEKLLPLARIAGCHGNTLPLDEATRATMGLDAFVAEAAIVDGDGARRALLIEIDGGVSLRDWLVRAAARLSSRMPHVLWLLVVTRRTGSDVALAAWSGDRRPPRVAALVTRRDRIVDSDAETLRALGTAPPDHDILAHARWVEVLGRAALSIRFFRALDRALEGLANSSTSGSIDVRREIALLQTSRLLFLCFLEAKGWLDRDPAFVANRFDACMLRGGRFQSRVLRPLFFGTLNTPMRKRSPTAAAFGRIPFLNGGLFSPTVIERRNRSIVFSDDAYGELIASVFSQYRFTAREETASWNEAAVDPEMLGRAFESLMARTERKKSGAYYTPFSLVERVADAGLTAYLGDDPSRSALERLTILDPACGSGAFLVHALERIADLLVHRGDWRPLSEIRRDVLTRSIHGVDVNPTAVWLCELRLWLSVAIESTESDPTAVLPLPNLDRNIRVGDALAGAAFGAETRRGSQSLAALRQRYARASGARKESLARQLDRAERDRALAGLDADLKSLAERRRDVLAAHRGRDLFGDRYRRTADERNVATTLRREAASLRAARRKIASGGALPFSFSTHFGDIASRGGFDLVVGNPPWVRLHNIALEERARYRQLYDVARAAAWESGAEAAGAGRAFGTQVDVAALFIERSVRLLTPGGCLSLLVPVKLWRSLAGGGVRRLLQSETTLERIEDLTDAASSFDAAVYPSLVVARRDGCAGRRALHAYVHHRTGSTIHWETSPARLPFDDTPGAPWLMLPPAARDAFDLLRTAGDTLAQSVIGRPLLGVKCGFNDAFIVELLDEGDDLAEVRGAGNRRFTVERALLRPLLRGEALQRWQPSPSREYIIWTHDENDAPLARLPEHAARWFARWHRHLAARSDARNRARWWSLFRTDSARCDRPRVAWCDVGLEPRACVLPKGEASVALNSCYIARCRDDTDARALAALLNGPVARAWLDAMAEPARGGYHRYLGWTLSLLPMPPRWSRARNVLAKAWTHSPPSDQSLFDASLTAYGLDGDAIEPLIAWTRR